MSAMVSVLDMFRLLVPEGLVAGREVVHDDVDSSRGDALGQLGDTALLQREIISEHRHPTPRQRLELGRVGRLARRQHPVLDEEQRHLVIALGQTPGQVVIVADVIGFKRIARLDEQVLSHLRFLLLCENANTNTERWTMHQKMTPLTGRGARRCHFSWQDGYAAFTEYQESVSN